MNLSLKSGFTVGHFRIVSPLGEGGMGEVYRAWDEELDREVALKVLPPERVGDQERLGRFVQEAKAASALAHPNIVTIHEIGEDTVPAGGEGNELVPVHFIAMELVEGPTLQELIHQQRVDLRTLLGILAQAAEGVARAHEAGVVHRDLKPENIMVTRDGYAKVLDFGLAKLDLVADPGDDVSSGPTAYVEATAEGMMMGTVGYMSPEQVHGRNVDHRTDIFAFGCLLYEAATRRRPFVGDSSIDVLHRIVHDPPPPMEELNPAVPGALRRVVKRCLAKDPARRAQSMKDLALELEELEAEFESLPPSTSSGISPSAVPRPTSSRRRSLLRKWVSLEALALAILGVAGAGWWWISTGDTEATAPAAKEDTGAAFQTMEIEPLTSDGTITMGALSPDGRYLAHTRAREGLVGLWIRQVSTGSDIEVVAPADLGFRGVSFTPDGEYLYFVREVPDRTGFSALYRVPTLGGEPRQIIFDIDAAVTFSPDAERLAFPRGIPLESRSAIMVADIDGSGLAELASLDYPERFPLGQAAWSPDGETIVSMVLSSEDLLGVRPMTIDVESGELQPLPGGHRFTSYNGIQWLPDGSGLVVVGRRQILDTGDQIWLIELPSGELRRISNDVNDYGPPSISADGSTLATVLSETVSHLYALPADRPTEVRQLTSGRREIAGDLVAGTDGTVVFQRRRADRIELWRTSVDGEPERLTSGDVIFDPALSDDGRVLLAAVMAEDGRPHVWRLDPETGTEIEQLTDGRGEASVAVSPDGRWFLFTKITSPVLWRQEVAGGEPARLAERAAGPRAISPDGRLVAYGSFEDVDGQARPLLKVITVGGEEVETLPWDLDGILWHPDGDALVVDRSRAQVGNLWKVPLDGSNEEQITRFDDQFIVQADWSPDGEWIFVTRGETTSDAVLIRDFR